VLAEADMIRRGYLDFAWGQVHTRMAEADPALPLLLLLHQSPLSARNYDRLLPLLTPVCRPVAIDTPGYGGSDLPDGQGPDGQGPDRQGPGAQWEVADYAALVLAIADRLGAPRFHLFARATGTVFALATALAAPTRLRSLALHGMPVYTAEERADRLARFAPPFVPQDDGSHLAWIWQRIHGEYPWIDAPLATQFVRDYLATGGDFATAYRAIWRYDLRAAAAGGLAVPTLLIGGTRDRIFFMHERARALLPQARAETLDGATDFVAEQEPARVAALLTAFMSGAG
jgi:pimeloyl-ACP methyl ester carboxylesterase